MNIAVDLLTKTTLLPSYDGLSFFDGYKMGYGLNAVTGATYPVSSLKNIKVNTSEVNDIEYFYQEIYSKSDFSKALSASGKTALNIGGFSASASSEYTSKLKCSKTSISYIAVQTNAAKQYDSLVAPFEFTEQAKKLLDESYDDFRKIYGDYFISGAKMGSKLVAIYTCQAETRESLEGFKAEAKSSYKNIFSAEGNTEFQTTAKKHNIKIELSIHMNGVKNTPSSEDKKSIENANEFYSKNLSPVPLFAQISHYSLIAPDLPNTLPIDPNIFSKIQSLHQSFFWLTNKFENCPGSYSDSYLDEFTKLKNDVNAHSPDLPLEPKLIVSLSERIDCLLKKLEIIYCRYDLYLKILSGKAEEKKTVRSPGDAKSGQIWTFGWASTDGVILSDDDKDVKITSHPEAYKKGDHPGHRGHVFSYSGSETMISGWKMTSNKDHNGHWENNSPNNEILTKSQAELVIKGSYQRGINYSFEIFTLPAKLFDF